MLNDKIIWFENENNNNNNSYNDDDGRAKKKREEIDFNTYNIHILIKTECEHFAC